MSSSPNSKLKFPKHFLWGAATAAHQVEGGNHNQWTVWELENAKALAAQAEYQLDDLHSWDRIKHEAKDPSSYVSGMTVDHYNRYEEDFDMLGHMNMNAYRFSVEWSRIEPEQGAWNAEAVMHYKDKLASLKRRNIEPIVTLFHFTMPVWFSELGGFEKRSNVKHFIRFAEKIVSELGPTVRFIITINEPDVYSFATYHMGMWPPATRSKFKLWRVINNLAYAHRQAYKAIHKLGGRHKISIAKNSVYFYAGDDSWLSRTSAAIAQYLQDDYLLKKVIKHTDFLGINYYMSQRIYGYRIHNPELPVTDLEWSFAPGDIQYVLERLYAKYKKPIIITENGLADATDESRQKWITKTIVGMQAAMENGVDLQGYIHWSLLDNFEWSYGIWPRFGLAAVDYSTGKRALRPSARWFGRVIKSARGL